MPPYQTPGVFIEEQDTGAHPILAVGTSTAGFVGTAPIADAGKGEAVPVDNWGQFYKTFVGEKGKSTDLANAVQGFFANGGSRCYIANIGADEAVSVGLDALNLIDEIAIIAAPGRCDQQSYNALLDTAELMKDRVAILDGPPTVDDADQLTRVGTGDGDSGGGGTGKTKAPKPGMKPRVSKYGAFYVPYLRVPDAINPSVIVSAPPSGHMAGLWAQTDATRGVHKAPANMSVRGAVGLTKIFSSAEQGPLNDAGVNVIRFFTREGIRVWGARTLDPTGNWKYLNVRRLFTMIEESIGISTRWVIFEPNDKPLWNDIKRDIGNFLRVLHSQGALAGDRPEQAFFVKCDRETNPPEIIDLGQVVVVVGIAPVKPAEFLIIRIGQSQGGTSVETA